MTDPFGMTDAELVQRYRRALAEIMAKGMNLAMSSSGALFGSDRRIVTHFNPPPIPDRSCDWAATDEATYDAGDPVGEGATEVDAILDLLDKLEAK